MKFLRRHPILSGIGGLIALFGYFAAYIGYIGYKEARGREHLFPANTAMELYSC